jgi:hypothetical protein
MAELEAMVLVDILINFGRETGNTAKALEPGKSSEIKRLAAILQNH